MASTTTTTSPTSATSAAAAVDQVIGVQIPTWPQLFNEDSQCECQECETITGAPHYLATLLEFLESCTANDNGDTPYDFLIKRVPYLPYLPLTCDNTNDELPYIRVVLDILEFYTANSKIAGMPAYDSGSDGWQTAFEQTAQTAYQTVSTAYFPFDLPYHQPLDTIRAWLSNVNSSWKELIAVFAAKDPNYALRLLKENLQLSDEGYTLLTQYQVGAGPVLQTNALYGYASTASFQSGIYGVPAFLAATGLQYAELITVLSAVSINPGTAAVQFIESLFINGNSNAQAIFQQLKTIATTPLDAALQATITTFLSTSVNPGLDPTLFKNWITAVIANFQNTIIIIPGSIDACDYSQATIATLLAASDSMVTPKIPDASFLRLYFFIRTLRLTGLSIGQLDILVAPLSSQSNDKILGTVGRATTLMTAFGWSAGQVASFYGAMDRAGSASTYGQLFLAGSLAAVNQDFQSDPFGNYFTTAVPAARTAQYTSVLLSGLQLTAADLAALVAYFGTADASPFNHSLDGVSVLYSYSLLAAALQLQLADMLGLVGVFGKPDVLRKWNTATSSFDDANLQDTLAFIEFVQTVTDSPFGVPELLYLLGMPSTYVPSVLLTTPALQQSLLTLQTGFAGIDQQNPADPAAARSLVLGKLLQTYSKDVVGTLAGMLDGTIVYTVVLPTKPALTIPTTFSVPVSYDPTSGTLTVTGVLSASDLTLAQTDANLAAAIQSIYNQPGTFLKTNFAAFISTDPVVSGALFPAITAPNTLAQQRYIAFYGLYQPALVTQLKTNLVLKTVASLLSLDPQLTAAIAQPLIGPLVTSLLSLTAQVSASTNTYPDVTAYGNPLLLIQKGGIFATDFALTATELTYFQAHAADFSGVNFNTFTLAQWQVFNQYYLLRKFNVSGSYTFVDLFAAAAGGGAIPAIVNLLVHLTRWRTDDINGIITGNGYTVADFRSPVAVFAMTKMMRVSAMTNLRTTQLIGWAQSATDFVTLSTVAASIKNTVLQPFSPSAQSDRDGTVSAPVLQRQRTALGLYILNLPEMKQGGVITFEDLSNHFYIDILMQAVMPTSRIRQAISTVQTFVTRVLMGLETEVDAVTKAQVGVVPNAITPEAWAPLSIFRVWQVTMEFLANPYPYLSYQYLIEKSVPALNLEQTLQKSDITPRAVENAYLEYLQDLCEVANLEIVSMYIEDNDTGTTPVIHVIGKSRSVPHNYYYCNKDPNGIWSFWTKITVGIRDNDADGNGPPGSHVIFIKFKSRYYLFLPEFISRQKPKSINQSASALSTAPTPDPTEQNYWEIKMAVSEYYQGQWTDKRYLKPDVDLTAFYHVNDLVSSYFFTTLVSTDKNGIESLQLTLNTIVGTSVYSNMQFSFVSLNSIIAVTPFTGLFFGQVEVGVHVDYGPPPPVNYAIYYQNIYLTGNDMVFPLPSGQDGPRIISDTERMYISFSPQYSVDPASIYTQPFFFHDNDRCYFVTSEPAQLNVTTPGQKVIPRIGILQPLPQLTAVIVHPEESLYQPMMQIQ